MEPAVADVDAPTKLVGFGTILQRRGQGGAPPSTVPVQPDPPPDPDPTPGETYYLLLETGDRLLLEDGFGLLLESAP